MAVEVDQSGRVEDLSTGTAIAFANGVSGALFVSAGAKRRVILYLHRNSLIPVKDVPAVFFSVLLFSLIRKQHLSALKIDEEYTKKNGIIEETLKKLFEQYGIEIPTIRFGNIGKRSSAHLLAWRIHRSKGRHTQVMKVLEKEVLKFMK